MIYQHPLAYLIGLEGLALLRAWAGDEESYDEEFVRARLAETRRLLDDPELADHPGVLVERNATAAAYAQWSTTYDDADNGLFDMDAPVIEEILTTLPVGSALDAACGTGRLTTRLVERGYRVVGVDSSPAMLDRARIRVPDAEFLDGDLQHLPVPDASVDLVVTGLALTHSADLTPVFAEFARVLRPGGHLVVSDVHDQLVFLGSTVKAAGADGQPQLATTHRHTAGDYLRAALPAGFTVRRFDEVPRPETPTEPLPEPSHELGSWSIWPWTLLDWDPAAARAAWNHPAVMIWHFQRG